MDEPACYVFLSILLAIKTSFSSNISLTTSKQD